MQSPRLLLAILLTLSFWLLLGRSHGGELGPERIDEHVYPQGTLAHAEIHGTLPDLKYLDRYAEAMAAATHAAARRAAQAELLLLTRRDPIELYRQLRAARPVLVLPDVQMVLVTRDRDVRRILENPTVFTVRDYRDRMEPLVGPYMLSRDSHPYYNIEEKPWMRSLMLRSDLPRIRSLVREATAAAIARSTHADGTLDVVSSVARGVPVTLVQEYFGFRAPTHDLLRWSFLTQDSFFHNIAYLRGLTGYVVRTFGIGAPELQASQQEARRVHEAAIAAGEEMRRYLDTYIAENRDRILAEDTILSRMLRVNAALAQPKEHARIRSNIMGGLIGAVETSNAAIVQSLNQLLARPEVFAKARSAAERVGPEDAIERSELANYVWEALRFHPINPFVVRFVEEDTVIGDGAHATRLEKGQRVLVATYAAMHDPRSVESPDEFRIDRPARDREMNLGYRMHRCLGDHIAEVMVPEVVRQLVLLPDVQRVLPSPRIEADMGIDFGPRLAFPERYLVQYAAEPSARLTAVGTAARARKGGSDITAAPPAR